MRISDWSSDVCSSDLAMIGIDHLARKYDLVAHLPADLAEAGQRDVERPRPGAEIDVAGHQPRQPERPQDRSHRQIFAVRHQMRLVVTSSGERRVGKEGVSKGRYRWSQFR